MRPKQFRGLPYRIACVLGRGILLICLLNLGVMPVCARDDGRPGLPDVSYPDLAGVPHSLKEWQGRVVLLNFWASWCSPCLTEIRHLVEFQHNYADLGIQVIGMGIDETRHLKNVQRSLEMNYPTLVAGADSGRKLLNAWGNETGMIPYTVVFDKQGRVVGAHRGVFDEQVFEELVLPLFSSK